jgi:hypothetical protein
VPRYPEREKMKKLNLEKTVWVAGVSLVLLSILLVAKRDRGPQPPPDPLDAARERAGSYTHPEGACCPGEVHDKLPLYVFEFDATREHSPTNQSMVEWESERIGKDDPRRDMNSAQYKEREKWVLTPERKELLEIRREEERAVIALQVRNGGVRVAVEPDDSAMRARMNAQAAAAARK